MTSSSTLQMACRWALVGLGVFPSVAIAQVYFHNLALTNSSCGFFDENYISFSDPLGISSVNNNLVIGTSGDYDFHSNGQIIIKSNTKISCQTGSTGRAIFRATNGNLDVDFLREELDESVPIYSTIELGLDMNHILSMNIGERINKFETQAYGILKPGTSAYDKAFADGYIINPYDPEHISVDCVLFPPSSPHEYPTVRHGFRYKAFDRVVHDDQADWEELSEPYPWRIRFTPDELGRWTGYVNIWIGNTCVQENFPMSFKVVGSNNPGIIKISPTNGKYFCVSGSNESFVPIGNNYAWPHEQWGNCHTANCSFVTDHRMSRNAFEEMTNFSSTFSHYNSYETGNCTRLLFTPWGYDIEREHLCDYATRQVEMWELDQYINELEKSGVRLILGQGEGEWNIGAEDYHDYNQGWLWNPYHDQSTGISYDPLSSYKGIADVHTLEDFLTNPTCQKFYKARLRYMEARWGYSTSIFMYDMLNEAHHITNSLDGDPTSYAPVREEVEEWCDLMAGYLKHDLHTQHLTIVASEDPGFGGGASALTMWERPNLDVVGAHFYANRESHERIQADRLESLRTIDKIEKPVVIEEWGSGDQYDLMYGCEDLDAHNQQWAMLLSGYAGPSMIWPWRRYNLDLTQSGYSGPPAYMGGTAYYGEYDRNYLALSRFSDQMDPASRNFIYEHHVESYPFPAPSGNNERFEVFMARDVEGPLFGWAHNRSSRGANSPYDCLNPMGYAEMSDILIDPTQNFINDQPQNTSGGFYNEDGYVTSAGFTSDNYIMYPLENYYIRVSDLPIGQQLYCTWFYTWGDHGGEPFSSPSYTVNGSGDAYFKIPQTIVSKDGPMPGDWAFIVTDHKIKSMFSEVTPEVAAPLIHTRFDANSGLMHASFSTSFTGQLRVFDATGHLIDIKNVPIAQDVPLDASKWSAGLYLIDAITSSGARMNSSVVITP